MCLLYDTFDITQLIVDLLAGIMFVDSGTAAGRLLEVGAGWMCNCGTSAASPCCHLHHETTNTAAY